MPLQIYNLRVKTKSPLFVGSGEIISKKEYLYDSRNQRVSIIDHTKLMGWLLSRSDAAVIDEYERFMLSDVRRYTLNDFFRNVHADSSDIRGFTLYATDAGAALPETGSLRNIACFARDSFNKPYLPGSSVKGAIRTAVLVKMMQENANVNQYKTESAYLNAIGQGTGAAANFDVMSGVSFADSLPIPQSAMILAGKIDLSKDGDTNRINIVRECVRPGTEIILKLTIKPERCGIVTADYIKQAISNFGRYYLNNFSSKFDTPSSAGGESFENCLLLGGGCGYFSKNTVYAQKPWNDAVMTVAEMMKKNFKRGKHEKDVIIGISPHTLKCTKVASPQQNGSRSLMQVGVCEISIEQVS